MFENIRLAWESLKGNKLRAALTMLGITIGTSVVIVLLSVGQAFENFILDEFNSFGTNLIAVTGEQNDRGQFEPLTQSDLEALSDPLRVPDAMFVVPLLEVTDVTVVYEEREQNPQVIGVTNENINVEQREVVAGRYIEREDQEGRARVAVIGSSVVENLFPPGVPPIGQSIRINDVRFRVVGVLDAQGGGGLIDLDNQIQVPLSTAQTRLQSERVVGGDLPITRIVLQARDQDSIDLVVMQITEVLREEHDIEFNGEDDFAISTQEDFLDTIGTILRLLTYFLAAIAGISLVVGGIGIMNIMLVTVTERTKEIGLRKAVGARNSDILLQFVTEALLLALLGGAIGIMIAALGGYIVTRLVDDLNVVVRPFSVLLATGIATFIGVIFGLFPALRAARLNPIDALRYE